MRKMMVAPMVAPTIAARPPTSVPNRKPAVVVRHGAGRERERDRHHIDADEGGDRGRPMVGDEVIDRGAMLDQGLERELALPPHGVDDADERHDHDQRQQPADRAARKLAGSAAAGSGCWSGMPVIIIHYREWQPKREAVSPSFETGRPQVHGFAWVRAGSAASRSH